MTNPILELAKQIKREATAPGQSYSLYVARDALLRICDAIITPEEIAVVAQGGQVTVGGNNMEWSLAEFNRRVEFLLADEQRKPNPDNALIAVLCNSIRLTRENKKLATSDISAVAGEPEESAWLIEWEIGWGTGNYWCGFDRNSNRNWGGIQDAIRFSRKQDAEKIIRQLTLDNKDERIKATEHMWCLATPAAPIVPEGMVMIQVERSYDTRAASMIAFNKAFGDLDDRLEAAHQAMLAASKAKP